MVFIRIDKLVKHKVKFLLRYGRIRGTYENLRNFGFKEPSLFMQLLVTISLINYDDKALELLCSSRDFVARPRTTIVTCEPRCKRIRMTTADGRVQSYKLTN